MPHLPRTNLIGHIGGVTSKPVTSTTVTTPVASSQFTATTENMDSTQHYNSYDSQHDHNTSLRRSGSQEF